MAMINDEMPDEAAPEAVPEAPEQGVPEAKAPGGKRDERVMRVVLAAMKILYDPKTSDGIVKMLRGGGEPAQTLANTALAVLRMLFEESKGRIPPEVLLAAADKVVALLAELADAAGLPVDAQMLPQVIETVRNTLQQKLQAQAPQGAQPASGMPQKPGGMINSAMGG